MEGALTCSPGWSSFKTPDSAHLSHSAQPYQHLDKHNIHFTPNVTLSTSMCSAVHKRCEVCSEGWEVCSEGWGVCCAVRGEGCTVQ